MGAKGAKECATPRDIFLTEVVGPKGSRGRLVDWAGWVERKLN